VDDEPHHPRNNFLKIHRERSKRSPVRQSNISAFDAMVVRWVAHLFTTISACPVASNWPKSGAENADSYPMPF
jgi:hypothetical protein